MSTNNSLFKSVIAYLLHLQDVKLLVEDIGELKPTMFCAVPRVLDRIYSGKLSFSPEYTEEIDFQHFSKQV